MGSNHNRVAAFLTVRGVCEGSESGVPRIPTGICESTRKILLLQHSKGLILAIVLRGARSLGPKGTNLGGACETIPLRIFVYTLGDSTENGRLCSTEVSTRQG